MLQDVTAGEQPKEAHPFHPLLVIDSLDPVAGRLPPVFTLQKTFWTTEVGIQS